MRALIHIGPPKTGSSTIQAFLRRNRSRLEQKGVASFAHDDWVRSISTTFRHTTPKTHWAHALGIDDADRLHDFRRRTADRLAKELAAKAQGTDLAVLSAEGFFGRSAEALTELKEFLDRSCTRVEVLAYLRRQDLLALSKHKNKVRNRRLSNPIPDSYNRQMDYWAHLESWGEVFGTDNIRIRLFPDSAPHACDLIEQFKAEILPAADRPDGQLVTPENRNTGWNWQALEFVRVANRVAPEALSDARLHHRFVRAVDTLYTGGAKPTMARSKARAIVGLYADSNEQVRRTFRPDLPELFHSDFSKFPETDHPQDISRDDAVRMAIELVANQMTQSSKSRTAPQTGAAANRAPGTISLARRFRKHLPIRRLRRYLGKIGLR